MAFNPLPGIISGNINVAGVTNTAIGNIVGNVGASVVNGSASVAGALAIPVAGAQVAGFVNSYVGPGIPNITDPNFNASVYVGDFADPNLLPISSSRSGGGSLGDWSSLEYATDMIDHQGKFKFLFKIKFGGPWEFYVKSCSKPKIRFIHQDINYYGFRTKVLTSTAFEPLQVTFWDEIGNSVNEFFSNYLSTVSGQGSGNWGVDESWNEDAPAISSKSYRNAGYGDPILATVIIEQIFANGTQSNRFIFKNARIESMDFDDMLMEDTGMNALMVTFNYDSIECETVEHQVINSWGQHDLLRGGGAAGGNAGGLQSDGKQFDPISIAGQLGVALSGRTGGGVNVTGIFQAAIPSIPALVDISGNSTSLLGSSMAATVSAAAGGAFNVGGGIVNANLAVTSPVAVLQNIIPDPGAIVSESAYVNSLSISNTNNNGALGNILTAPFGG